MAPLTILAGINSSGKSTLIQSLLLVSQTLGSNVASRSVVLNGQLVKLGQFSDLRSFGSEYEQITVGFQVVPGPSEQIDAEVRPIDCEFSFDVGGFDLSSELQQLQPGLFGFRLLLTERGPADAPSGGSMVVTRREQPFAESVAREDQPSSSSESEVRQGLNYQVALSQGSLDEIALQLGVTRVEPVGCIFQHFLPQKLIVRYDAVQRRAHRLSIMLSFAPSMMSRYITRRVQVEALIPGVVLEVLREKDGSVPAGLLDVSSDSGLSVTELFERVLRLDPAVRQTTLAWFREMGPEIERVACEAEGTSPVLAVVDLPYDLANALTYLQGRLSRSVRYLGPLRDEPKPIYPLAPTADPQDVGLRGEYTAAVFHRFKDHPISYVPSDQFGQDSVNPQPVNRTLEAAVMDWLQYMGVIQKVQTIDRGKLGHEMQVTTPGTDVLQDLTHVGVGVSQVLPIVVSCLLARQETTLVFEQPELHLHPKVQALLGDFFLSMAFMDKQCILETHSEYLINRLRYRAAAADPDDGLIDRIGVYFVEKQEGASRFRPVVINQFGAIADWPKDFFDQGTLESQRILRAALEKRKALQQRRGGADG